MNRSVIHNRRIILFALLLFIAMQYSAVLHGSVHFFHAQDNACVVFNLIEHSSAGLIGQHILIPRVPLYTQFVVHSLSVKPVAYYIFLPSRAPPLV